MWTRLAQWEIQELAASRKVRKKLYGERMDAAPINHDDPVAFPESSSSAPVQMI